MESTLLKLSKSIAAYPSNNFKDTLKNEIQAIKSELLPLQQGLTLSSYVGKAPLSAVIFNVSEEEHALLVKTGIFYTGIIAGCSCSDDPSPTDEQNEYCELLFNINKDTAETCVTLLGD